MQLKTLGESLVITKTINEVLTSTAHIGNTYMDNAVRANALAVALKGYSTEAIKAAIAQSSLNAEQIRAILIEKGLTGQLLETTTAELAQATTTNALAVSEGVATTATVGLGNAFKGLGASMKTFALSHPVLLAIAAVGVTVYGVVKAYDALTVSVEEANEAMQDAVGEYDSAKSSLESVNTELEEQNKKLDELLAKDKLTYAEKGQLEELQAITKELILQQDIEQRRVDKASKDVASKTVDAYNKQYGKHDVSREHLKETLDYTKSTGISPIAENENDIVGNIAAYLNVTEGLKKAQQEYETALNNGEDTEFLIEDVQDYIDAIDDYSDVLDQNISDLQEKRLALEDEYNKAVAKRDNGQDLTSYETDAISTYESIYDAIKLIYEYTNKNDWNNMEISSIFNTEGIEKTKEELISMYKSGELSSAEMLGQFPKLNQAIKDSEIIASEGSDAFKEFFNEIVAMADGTDDAVSAINSTTPTLTISDTIDQLNTQLKPTFDSLKSAYQDIFTTDDNGKPLFTLENVDLSMLDSIKSAIDELNENDELGISIDYSSFENLARTLTDTASTESDVRNGFNKFITDVVYGTAALENLNASDAKLIETMLESLGVTNAHEIVYDSLIAKTEALALQEQLLASVGGDLANATADKVLAFLNQAGASEVARNYLIKLIAEEQVFSNQDLDVSGKISKLQELAQAYGQTALAAKIASQEKANEQSHTVGSWSEADLQQFQKEWNDGLSSVSIDFSPKNSSKSKKSGSSKKEKDLWLEEYKRKLAEFISKGYYQRTRVLLTVRNTPKHLPQRFRGTHDQICGGNIRRRKDAPQRQNERIPV